ncbi:COX15/CtaA family protein [Geobacter sp.]|uniref:COX15/CtaA family protein n=1 Tax=Geobacter sp. TaxID=46610 RepID=UPI00260ACAD0|nr:COX15/CtaA family protein [Geobacter sp.]
MLGRITVSLFFLLLVWGNLVAGMKAGLACPDWPLCQGRVLPPFRLDIWMEFTHRVIAAVATVSLLLLAAGRLKSYRGLARAVPLAAVAILAAEIVIGGMVVLLELPANLTTLHFVTGTAVFLLAAYMARFEESGRTPGFSARGTAGLTLALILLVASQAALGAYVRHAGAGLACPDFPTCGGGWLPPLVSTGVAIQVSHRLFACLILVTLALFWVATRLDARLAPHRRAALALLLLGGVQVALGGVVVLSGLSYVATACHLAVALVLMLLIGRIWAAEVTRGGS